eukprot:TRINITY_DN38727_c0_g1_i1.p1 TRINITY_DN38727_c0_g1~~TRINITY_DN38727_c0_g1_i1.p1  ORF type:complete len:454 (-),score=55.00 TRINITY_DN38727_c0_g1_i1:51-1412(-)
MQRPRPRCGAMGRVMEFGTVFVPASAFFGIAPASAAEAALMPTAAQTRMRDVALCIAGPVSRLPPDETLDNAKKMALWWGADVFGVFVSRANIPLPFPLQGWFVDYAFFHDGNGPRTLRDEYERANPSNRSGDLLEAYNAIGGNFLGPLVGNDGRNAYMVRDLWRCYQVIHSHEDRHAIEYRYLAYSRLDLHWVAQPPPLHLLVRAAPKAIWIPDGQDWDGLNDRFALVPRHLALAYFARWPRLLNGTLLPSLLRAIGRGNVLRLKFDGGPEWLLRASLHAAGAAVRRFSPVAAVLCQTGSRRGRYGRCTRPWPGSGLIFKYSSEASEAHVNAARLRSAGWRWRSSAAASPILEPPCFESDDDRRGCCSPTAGLNGDADCWTDVYSFARCCDRSAQLGVWLLPSPRQARDLLRDNVGQACWTVVTAVSMCVSPGQLEQLVLENAEVDRGEVSW